MSKGYDTNYKVPDYPDAPTPSAPMTPASEQLGTCAYTLCAHEKDSRSSPCIDWKPLAAPQPSPAGEPLDDPKTWEGIGETYESGEPQHNHRTGGLGAMDCPRCSQLAAPPPPASDRARELAAKLAIMEYRIDTPEGQKAAATLIESLIRGTLRELGFVEALKLVEKAYAEWASKPHNQQWRKRLEGTPIPNDLSVTIASHIAVLTLAERGEIPARQQAYELAEKIMGTGQSHITQPHGELWKRDVQQAAALIESALSERGAPDWAIYGSDERYTGAAGKPLQLNKPPIPSVPVTVKQRPSATRILEIIRDGALEAEMSLCSYRQNYECILLREHEGPHEMRAGCEIAPAPVIPATDELMDRIQNADRTIEALRVSAMPASGGGEPINAAECLVCGKIANHQYEGEWYCETCYMNNGSTRPTIPSARDTASTCGHGKWDARFDCLTCLQNTVNVLNAEVSRLRIASTSAPPTPELAEADLRAIISHVIYDPIDMPRAVEMLNEKYCKDVNALRSQLAASRALHIEETKRQVTLIMGLQKLMADQTPDLLGERLIKASEIGKLIQ